MSWCTAARLCIEKAFFKVVFTLIEEFAIATASKAVVLLSAVQHFQMRYS